MTIRRLLLVAPAALFAQSPGNILGRLGLGGNGENKIADGLKEALRVGAINPTSAV
ncbi:MAG: hypothetical protein ACKV2U_27110 [Bryobacteraceae bacterium]